jgi:arylsulfatase B
MVRHLVAFTTFLLALTLLQADCTAKAPANNPNQTLPNVVVILADDLGWADVSYHGGYIKTPQIDKLAKEGVELDRFYVCPMCSPTRAGLMTGRYPIRFGLARAVIPPWRDFGLDTAEVTLADVMGQAGYKHRGMFGKWHLGHSQRKWHPNERGFTEFLGHYNGAIDYFDLTREGERDWHHNYQPSDQTGYSTNLIAAGAAEFIRRSAKDGPFFCYVPFNAPHSPFQAPQKYLDQYKHLAPKSSGKKKKGNKSIKQTLAAMVTCMDDGIGQVLTAIDDAGVRDNTIVWFFSDNGGIKSVKENNLPLRGDKLSVFEGGVRVPACIRWPAGIKGGRKVTAPMANIDVLPTLMSIAGKNQHGGKPLDGLNVLPNITGETNQLDRDLFFYHGQSGNQSELYALTTPQWKLVVLGPNIIESDFKSDKHQRMLFAIHKDPFEKNNLADQHPDVVSQLGKRLVEFRKLQPQNSVPAYGGGRGDFKAPKAWKIPAQ